MQLNLLWVAPLLRFEHTLPKIRKICHAYCPAMTAEQCVADKN